MPDRRPRAGWGADPALRLYGAALALVQGVVALWWSGGRAAHHLSPETDPICWPLWQDCLGWRALMAQQLDWLLPALLVGSGLVALLFASRRTAPLGCIGLVALKLVELAVLFGDFRLRGNQHYMALLALLVFLLAGRWRRDALRVLLVSIYVAAGLLKLDPEWISGAGLYRPLWFFDTPALITAACVYVIVLELGVVWGLLARRRWIFWGAFGQFVVFHIFSWPVVDFFYPMVMFGLLAIFPAARAFEPPEGRAERSLLVRLFTGRAGAPVYLTVVTFAALQLPPVLIPGDEAVTGEGRITALHMFDARVGCRSYLRLHDGRRAPRTVSLNGRLNERIGCDPWVILARARFVCSQPGMADLPQVDLRHFAGRRTAPLREVVRVDDICRQPLEYRWLGRNDWIQLDGAPFPPATP